MAHKKGLPARATVAIPPPSGWGLSGTAARSSRPARSWSASAVPNSIPASTSGVAAMTPCSPRRPGRSSSASNADVRR